jgi:hypothetical protein
MSRTLVRLSVRVLVVAGVLVAFGQLLLIGWTGVLQLFE